VVSRSSSSNNTSNQAEITALETEIQRLQADYQAVVVELEEINGRLPAARREQDILTGSITAAGKNLQSAVKLCDSLPDDIKVCVFYEF
jgi:predicted  nucleic acid-binding Zn-ribbon protein